MEDVDGTAVSNAAGRCVCRVNGWSSAVLARLTGGILRILTGMLDFESEGYPTLLTRKLQMFEAQSAPPKLHCRASLRADLQVVGPISPHI